MKIRDGHRHDAAAIGRMINVFNQEEGSPGRITSEGVVDLCFGDQRLYKTIVAEDDAGLVGYAMVSRYFDTYSCADCGYMQDLYVVSERRSEGIGQRLIAAAASYTVDQNWYELVWHVRDRNARGRAFYARMGAKEQTPILVTLAGDALKTLAKEGAGD